jgi:hypothetical protein
VASSCPWPLYSTVYKYGDDDDPRHKQKSRHDRNVVGMLPADEEDKKMYVPAFQKF